MPAREVTHITIDIIGAEKKRIMAMSDAERIVYMNEEAERQNKPQVWSSAEQNLNPFPKWVRDFLARQSTSKPRLDPLNRVYYIQLDGDMGDACEWMESLDEALKAECNSDPEKAKWSAENCLKASITDADEAANMADLEGFLRGSAPDYHKNPKDERDAQDEDADVEVEAGDIEESA